MVHRDSDGFVGWLSGYVSRFGMEAVVTDDLSIPTSRWSNISEWTARACPVLDTGGVSCTSESGCGIDWLR